MTQLYPIGTQLITWRLSQAALYYEIFDAKNMESFSAYEGKWIKGFKTHIPQSERSKRGDEDFVSKWRVTVTKENQKWLRPVPMVGDLVWVENMGMAFEIGAIADNQVFKSAHKNPFADDESSYFVSSFYCSVEDNPKILSRTYPDGQRAPMIEWDTVILPA